MALLVVISAESSCPTWLYPSGDGHCLCGSGLGTVIACNNETRQVGVLRTYCLTSTGDGSNISVVGKCLAFIASSERLLTPVDVYVKVMPNIHDQDEETCGSLNRQGLLCGQCKPNHSVSAYSYDLKCYPCTSSVWSGFVKYICVAYLPLTIFLCVVVVFRISVTSPAMNVPVLCCQVLSLPFVLRVAVKLFSANSSWLYFVKFLATVYGIWNLDFFRTLIPPLYLQLNMMQLIALDYLVAVYPLLLLVFFYVLVTAHDRGCRLVVRLWRPFRWCTARLRQQWNVKHSIIDAFATFLLLSYVKLINTSAELLLPINIYTINGSWDGAFFYNVPTIQYMGPHHLPYAILAILVLLVGVLFPLLLLLLYPMMWFQRCLNRCHLNTPGLRFFMECFQGYYRDRTDGGWECRYFAAVYLWFRIATYLLYSITLGNMLYCTLIVLILCTIFAIGVLQPYKHAYKLYIKLDLLMMICLGVVVIAFMQSIFTFDEKDVSNKFGCYVAFVFTFTPLVYFLLKTMQFIKYYLFQNVCCSYSNHVQCDESLPFVS